jgi:hypothetical protein
MSMGNIPFEKILPLKIISKPSLFPWELTAAVKPVFKDHTWGNPKVVFEGRWSLLTDKFVL